MFKPELVINELALTCIHTYMSINSLVPAITEPTGAAKPYNKTSVERKTVHNASP